MTVCIFLLLSRPPLAQIRRHSISSLGSVFSKIKGASPPPSSPLLSFPEVWINFHWPWHSRAWHTPSQGSEAFLPLSRFAPLLPDCGKVWDCEFGEGEKKKGVVRFKCSLWLASLTCAAISLLVAVAHGVYACCSDVELLQYPEIWKWYLRST